MALSDLYSNLSLLLRWLHVIAGITWLGHLYFFNFVNVPLQGALDEAGKKTVNPQLMPRALWWFRWAAKLTFVAGIALFIMTYAYAPGIGFTWNSLFRDEGGVTQRAIWIMIGMTLGTILWFNVWFVVWPAQKKILQGRATAEEIPILRRRVYWVSRISAYLTGPLLFGMLAPSHYGAINATTVIAATAVSVLVIWWALRASSSVGRSA